MASGFWLSFLAAFGVGSCFLIMNYRIHGRIARDRGCCPPPSIRQRDPIFRLDIVLQLFRALKENRRNTSLKALFGMYGHTFQSKSWNNTTFYTIEPKNLQSVYTNDFSSWGVQPMRLFAFEPFVGKGIMCTDGAFWEHSRALIKPAFARTQIADLHLPAYESHVKKLTELIPGHGATVDLQPLFARLALDASTEFLFGESVASLSPELISTDAAAFLQAYDHGQKVVGRRTQLPQWNFLIQDNRFKDSCKIAHHFVEEHISKASQMDTSRFVLAYELTKATQDFDNIRNQLLNVFLPAHEAVGVALTNIFFHLARHPHIYSKLRNEILNAGKDRLKWTFERLKSVKYLQYVINETFRLNPAIGTNTRIALQDTVLPTGGGSGKSPIYVRKGDTIMMSFYALHRRQDLFGDDAHVFRPERWDGLRPAPWSYLTFGGGPRVCPGQNLALTETGYAIVRILETFERIENRDPVEEFVEVYKLTTDSKNGAKVALWHT